MQNGSEMNFEGFLSLINSIPAIGEVERVRSITERLIVDGLLAGTPEADRNLAMVLDSLSRSSLVIQSPGFSGSDAAGHGTMVGVTLFLGGVCQATPADQTSTSQQLTIQRSVHTALQEVGVYPPSTAEEKQVVLTWNTFNSVRSVPISGIGTGNTSSAGVFL